MLLLSLLPQVFNSFLPYLNSYLYYALKHSEASITSSFSQLEIGVISLPALRKTRSHLDNIVGKAIISLFIGEIGSLIIPQLSYQTMTLGHLPNRVQQASQ